MCECIVLEVCLLFYHMHVWDLKNSNIEIFIESSTYSGISS